MLGLKCIGGALLGALVGAIASIALFAALLLVVGILTWSEATGTAVAKYALILFPIGVVVGFLEPISDERKRVRKQAEAARAADKLRADHKFEEQQNFIREQRALRRRIVDAGDTSLKLFENAPMRLCESEVFLDQAEGDFGEGAFAPFWDSIENATRQLGLFLASIRLIREAAVSHTQLTSTLAEVPPKFPVSLNALARLGEGSATAERLKHVVRAAQRNFQFAVIYEQRKTNQLLVAGFGSLADALDRMSSQITLSIGDLSTSIEVMSESVTASVGQVHERMIETGQELALRSEDERRRDVEARARESKALEMLDNIQRGRRPRF